jgi:hypothetical protein
MLSQIEKDYISNGFIEVYESIGMSVKYVPLDRELSGVDKFGKLKLIYQEDAKVDILIVFEPQEQEDVDINLSNSRKNAYIQIIKKQLTDNGITIQLRDALDITLEGVTDRYVIVGFDKRVELNEIFSRPLITTLKDALSP